MISLIDCYKSPTRADIIWLGGGQTSVSYYNSTNNQVLYSIGCYMGNSVGTAETSFLNVVSGTATESAVIFSDSACIIRYSNFYNDKVLNPIFYFMNLNDVHSSVDHCVFSGNSAETFLIQELSVTDCSFNQNTFAAIAPNLLFTGSYSFIVNTQCHIGGYNDCHIIASCMSRCFFSNSFLLLYFILLA